MALPLLTLVLAVLTALTLPPGVHARPSLLPQAQQLPDHAQARCTPSTFLAFLPANASLVRVDAVPAGGTYPSPDDPATAGLLGRGAPQPATDLPALCAVTVRVASSSNSSYRFGLFLPAVSRAEGTAESVPNIDDTTSTAASRIGRLLATGNGAFLGGIDWLTMGANARAYAPSPQLGGAPLAALSTDTGHDSGPGDLSWALGAPEARADWGWRAVHGSVTLGKALARAYYADSSLNQDGGSACSSGSNSSNTPPMPVERKWYTYWSGCSTGGRQGLREMHLSPDSFDGALLGAPAWDTRHLMAWLTAVGTWNLPAGPGGNPGAFTAQAQLDLLAATVLEQCDGVDGVMDGIVSAPEACRPDFARIQCSEQGLGDQGDDVEAGRCLRPEQIATARKLYGDYYVTTAGDPQPRFVSHGLPPSSENQWDVWQLHGNAAGFDTAWEKYFLYDDPGWDWTRFEPAAVVVADAERADPGAATADRDGYDLSAFRDRGGKAIMYHGLADGMLPARSSTLYYNRTREAMAGRGGGAAPPMSSKENKAEGQEKDEEKPQSDDIDDFFRYFQVPGMQHCYLSPSTVNAPWMFGGWAQAGFVKQTHDNIQRDARHDALLALMAWVEHGTAVASVVATTWANVTGPGPVAGQRPLCPYPQTAVYDGVGPQDEAASWRCG